MGFNPERVQSNIEKLNKARAANAKPQTRMDSFFKVKANPNNAKIAAKKERKATSASSSDDNNDDHIKHRKKKKVRSWMK